jgi:hypothetical protein
MVYDDFGQLITKYQSRDGAINVFLLKKTFEMSMMTS